jgi:hypothetical protein
VRLPHRAQLVENIWAVKRCVMALFPEISAAWRSFLVWRHEGQQPGTLVSRLDWKYACSTALKIKNDPQSRHLMDLFDNINWMTPSLKLELKFGRPILW